MPVWYWWWAIGAAGSIVALALAILVFTSRPNQPQNRLLGLLLLLIFIAFAAAWGILPLMPTPRWAQAAVTVTPVVLLLEPTIYLLFLGTLDTKWSRWLAAKNVRRALWGVTATVPLLWWFTRDYWPFQVTGYDAELGYGLQESAGWNSLGIAVALVGLFSAIVAISLLRNSPRGSPMRKQAGHYAAAFVTYDLATFVLATGDHFYWSQTPWYVFRSLAWPIVMVIFVSLLAYGILRSQMFGIELKVKLGISRTTFVAIYAGIVLLVSNLIEQILDVDKFWPAVGTAVLVALAFKPIEKIGHSFADRLMPKVQDTPEYRARRSREVYQAAWEGMLVDGKVTAKEHDVLAALAADLGLGPSDVRAIEKAA